MSSVGRFARILPALLLAAAVSCATQEPDEPAATTEAEDIANVLSITEREYAFEVSGAPKAGTLTIDVSNEGKEWHELAMLKLKPGKTVDDVRAVLPKSEEDEKAFDAVSDGEDTPIDDLGGNQFPGTSYAITGSGIEAGEYALMCFVPNADGKPHWSLGMLTGFSVGSEENDEGPVADATYTVDDKGLEGPDELEAGEQTLRVSNDSKVSREIGLLHVEPGKTTDDIGEWFESAEGGQLGPPDPATAPVDFFASTFDAEQDRTMTLELTPGMWAISAPDPEKLSDLPPDKDPFAVVITVE